MPGFIVHYDLFKSDREDYGDLYQALEDLGAVRATESAWFVEDAGGAIEIKAKLAPHVHPDDVLAVNALATGQGWATQRLSPEALKWLKEHLETRPPRKAIRS